MARGPVLGRASLGEVVNALGGLLLAHQDLDDVEINPLRPTAGGPVALDALMWEDTDADADR